MKKSLTVNGKNIYIHKYKSSSYQYIIYGWPMDTNIKLDQIIYGAKKKTKKTFVGLIYFYPTKTKTTQ